VGFLLFWMRTEDVMYVLCYPNSKQPIGVAWQDRTLSAAEAAKSLQDNPRLNVGLALGARSGLIDVECDSPDAADAYTRRLGHLPAPGWQSTRGRHYLYRYDERLAPLPAVVKYDGIEFRLGNLKAAQSICPPSTVDGVRRQWTVSPDQCPPPPLPEDIIEALLALPRAAKPPKPGIDLPETRRLTLRARLLRYCDRVGLPVATVQDDGDRTVISLAQCPFREPNHDDGGAAVLVFPDGFGFHCFHPHCADKHWGDMEELYGPLVPTIRLSPDLEKHTSEVIAALRDDPGVYQRGMLVEIIHDADKPPQCVTEYGCPQVRPIAPASVKRRVSAVARVEKYDARSDEWVHAILTPDLTAAVMNAPEFPGVPVVTGVTTGPALRANGSVVCEPGYDSATGLYLDLDGEYPPLPKVPEAIAMLRDVLHDFPFEKPSHEAAAIAGIVTMVSRPAIAGSCPFVLVDANNTRVGKGLLTDVMTLIAYGQTAARYDFRSGEELSKSITAVAIGGMPYICLDNIKGTLGGSTLENALTATRWSSRILGVSRVVEMPLQIVWLGTANNCEITADMVNRLCYVRLVSNLENPSERSGFRYPELLQHVAKCRKALSMAALAIPARFIEAGRPDQKLKPFGGFENWSNLVRQSIVWAGLPDPAESRPTASANETTLCSLLVDGWRELGFPATVAKAITLLDMTRDAEADPYPILREAVSQLDGTGNVSNRLGVALRTYRGRVAGRHMLVRSDNTPPKWSVTPVS
jgi:hypothetical protein